MRLSWCIAIVLAWAIAPALADPILPVPSTTQPHDSPQSDAAQVIARSVAQLSDADPAVRRTAANALIAIGFDARPAVLAAANSDNPQLADAAQQVLRQLPWWSKDDPPDVARLLQSYGPASVADRIGIVAQLDGLPQSQPALLRLLGEELNLDVCWRIEAQLAARPDPTTLSAARQLDPRSDNPAALLLAARAWLVPIEGVPGASHMDRDQALRLMRRAVDLEATAPSVDDGELDFAFDQLAADAVEHQRYEQAADLRRQQCQRTGVTRAQFPAPLFELLALHAQFGPLPHFADDLRDFAASLNEPEALFVLSQMNTQRGQAMSGALLEQAAIATALVDSRVREDDIATFLWRHGWTQLAADMCLAALQHAPRQPDQSDVNARLLLGRLAAARGDDQLAADELQLALADFRSCQTALAVVGSPDLAGNDPARPLEIEHAHYALHAAQARHDTARINQQLDELMRLGPEEEDTVIELVPILQASGRQAQAKQIFEKAYGPLKVRIDAGEFDSTLWNDTAWLCARCGLHLDEALDWSNRAVAAEPDNPAFLDTNAEAHFRKGLFADAVRLETLALKYQPRDAFMTAQLKRFNAALSANGKP